MTAHEYSHGYEEARKRAEAFAIDLITSVANEPEDYRAGFLDAYSDVIGNVRDYATGE